MAHDLGSTISPNGRTFDGLTDTGRRYSFSRVRHDYPLPNLIQVQRDSFEWFKTNGLAELLSEISPIVDYNDKLELHFLDHTFLEPRATVDVCRDRDMTFSAPLEIGVRLVIKETGEIKESRIFLGDFPMMTEDGTFVINGAERVVVSQLVRSPGVYLDLVDDPIRGRRLCRAKLIPNRGAWLEMETSNRDVMTVKIDRKRKLPITILLRAVGYEDDEQLYELFEDVDTNEDHRFIASTIERDPTKTRDEAMIELYRRLRPGDPPTKENAQQLVEGMFFDPRRYDLARVGRFKLNGRLDRNADLEHRVLDPEDLLEIVREMVRLNNGVGRPDEIDHLGNRRVRAVGELIQMNVRTGLQRLERGVKERMTIQDIEQVTPNGLISTTRPVMAAVREFFGGSQLSQFMDQTNPLSELTHKRRLSALGPGGLSRDRAGVEVRDVHHSHYGRICPIETPEGPNIGLIGTLATFGQINEFGFVETPYRKVYHRISGNDALLKEESGLLIGKTLFRAIDIDGETVTEGTRLDADLMQRIFESDVESFEVQPFVSDEIIYLSADKEERFAIAPANEPLTEDGQFSNARVPVRHGRGEFEIRPPSQVDFMDVSPKQIMSVSASLVPFLEHDDANRALMGANMQRQAVPLLRPEAPLVGTGLEYQAARDSGQVIVARADGEVVGVTATTITIEEEGRSAQIVRLRMAIGADAAVGSDEPFDAVVFAVAIGAAAL